MNQFDKTTSLMPESLKLHNSRKEGSELYENLDTDQIADFNYLEGHTTGRNELKESMVLLADFLSQFEKYATLSPNDGYASQQMNWMARARDIRHKIIDNGNWPLE